MRGKQLASTYQSIFFLNMKGTQLKEKKRFKKGPEEDVNGEKGTCVQCTKKWKKGIEERNWEVRFGKDTGT